MHKYAVAAILVAALTVRGAVLVAMPGALADDPDGYRAMAENLLDCGVLGHGERPSAFRPPLYPLLLTPCVACGPWSRTAIGLLHLALGLATVWVVWLLGRRCGLGDWALLAAGLVAVDPILVAQSTRVMTETPAALAVALGLLALVTAAERPTAVRVSAAGALVALGGLCRPELLTWATALVALGIYAAPCRGATVQRRKVLAVGACAMGLVLAPWAVRNWIQFGRPVLGTTHGGYTLLLGNNPWFYNYLETASPGEVWDASAFHAAWGQRVAAARPDGELATNAMAYRDAWETITARPATALYAAVVRAGRFWQLVPHASTDRGWPFVAAVRWAIGAYYAVLLLLAALGGWAVMRGRVGGRTLRMALLFGGVLAVCLTVVHLGYWTNMRMRGPLVPAIALAAAAGAAWGARGGVGRKS